MYKEKIIIGDRFIFAIGTTEKKHWQNGHSKRGKNFHSFAISILNIGLLLSICPKNYGGKLFIAFDIYKLERSKPYDPARIRK